ncbi:hypothetical protein GGE07_005891 [Sinorhizobium terangae]|nr:hypothetical protein [Sinorhizobium terangae]MBB4189210.1 hypothetical protein [Sinorhizobium terangae]
MSSPVRAIQNIVVTTADGGIADIEAGTGVVADGRCLLQQQ